MLDQLLTSVGWFAGGLWRRSGDVFDVVNGLLDSIVAVTGDAHQAQVAQDIFRQEVRIERSVRIREDIRDAHKLMIENVQTQLLMGSIILGICFAVLVEGKPTQPDKAPEVVQELWAVFSVWAVSFSLLSVWFALQFQQEVSVSARRRLLDKHRVFTPNDDVVGRMGGLSLAEKVAQLHQGFLNEVAGCLASSTGSEAVLNSLVKRATLFAQDSVLAATGEIPPEHSADDGPQRICSNSGLSDADLDRRKTADTQDLPSSATAPSRPILPLARLQLQRLHHQRGDLGAAKHLEVRVKSKGQWEETAHRHPIAVRVGRGERAWFEGGGLSEKQIVDLPDFLLDETLVRCSWSMPRRRRLVHFMVRGTATLYVAAQWPPFTRSEAFRGQGPPPTWKDGEAPTLACGGAGAPFLSCFRRVEGFSILVSEKKMDLPVYRAELQAPDSSGWCEVRLKFRFPGEFEAPILILRRGTIPSEVCEEDWPVMEFMNELTDIQPLREDSMHYMSRGLLNLLLAAFFAHLGRVLTDRPWPQCRREVVLIICALLPAFFLSLSPDRIMQNMLKMHIPRHKITGGRRTPGARRGDTALSSDTDQPSDGDSEGGGCGPGPHPPAEAMPEGEAEGCVPSPPETPRAASGGVEPRPDLLPRIDSASSGGDSDDFLCCMPKGGGRSQEPVLWSFAPQHLQLDADRNSSEADAVQSQELVALEGTETGASPAEDAPVEQHEPTRLVVSPPWNDACIDDRPRERRVTLQTQSSNMSILSATSTECAGHAGHGRRCNWMPELSKLQIFKNAVRLLWASSIAWILAAWCIDLLNRPTEGTSSLPSVADAWHVLEISPTFPLFAPTAAALAPDGLLWIASDWLLMAVNYSGASSMAVGHFRLPVAAKGLIIPNNSSGRLLVADESWLHLLDVASVPLDGSRPVAVGLRGMTTNMTLRSLGKLIQMPRAQLGPAAAVAAARLPQVLVPQGAAMQGRPKDIVTLASATGGVYLCAAADLHAGPRAQPWPEEGPLQLEAAVSVPAPVLPRAGRLVRALHLCAEPGGCGVGEPVLWAADGLGCLTATGLDSGRGLGAWRWPLDGPGSPVALAGNASHLLAITRPALRAGPRLFVATYEALFAVTLPSLSCRP